jgi:hypothetical protein
MVQETVSYSGCGPYRDHVELSLINLKMREMRTIRVQETGLFLIYSGCGLYSNTAMLGFITEKETRSMMVQETGPLVRLWASS